MKVSELTGAALDWAVAQCEGDGARVYIAKGCQFAIPPHPNYCARGLDFCGNEELLNYSTSWSLAGPIIEREGISLLEAGGGWGARPKQDGLTITRDRFGPTPLIAAMRCYVASKLGDDINIPEAL